MKVLVAYYSMYGHIHKMAEAVAEGAKTVEGTEVKVCRIQETLSDEILSKMGALEAKKLFSNMPICNPEDLAEADAVIFGTPTRFGNMAAQMKQFIDSTGKLWMDNALAGKVASVFTSSATQHGGQESTILSFHIALLHQGMIIVGLPYLFEGQMMLSEISGNSPYGASTITGSQGERMPSKNELDAARFQGKYVAMVSSAISKSRNDIIKAMKK